MLGVIVKKMSNAKENKGNSPVDFTLGFLSCLTKKCFTTVLKVSVPMWQWRGLLDSETTVKLLLNQWTVILGCKDY